MKNDALMAVLVFAAVLLVLPKKSAAKGNGVGLPVIGDGGTIWTADSQYFYDGEFWYKLATDGSGYRLIEGQ